MICLKKKKNKKETFLRENLFSKSFLYGYLISPKICVHILAVFYIGILLLYMNNTSMISPVF